MNELNRQNFENMKSTERKLVERAKQGDRQAFGKLVKKYQNKVLYLAHDLVGNYNDAQDVAQNAFFSAFRNIASFRDEATFSTWIYRITTNAAIDFQRSKKRKKTMSLNQPVYDDSEDELIDTLQANDQPIDKRIEDVDLKNLVASLVDILSPQQQAAFVLKYFHEKSTAEIAEILQCDPITVRGHILRATQKMRKKMKGEK